MPDELMPFQKVGVRRISRFDGRMLLADDMGLGKTFQTLAWIKRHKEYPAIVICPASLKINWQRECWDKIGVRASIISGRKIGKGRDAAAIRKQLKSAKIVIINFEILPGWMRLLKSLGARVLVVDECDRLGNRKTQRTRKVQSLAKLIPNMIALSGTPMTNRPKELWPVLNMLKPNDFPAFTPFAIEFCNPFKDDYGRWNYDGACNLKRLHNRMKRTVMLRRRKKHVLKELPALRRSILPMELPAAGRKEYNAVAKDLAGWLRANLTEDKAKRALKAEALVRSGYLKRIAARWKLPGTIEWVESFFQETDRKLILFCVHKEIAKGLYDHFKGQCVVVNGSTSKGNRQRNIDAFKNSSKIRLFIGNIKAAGVGLNLTEASDVAFCEVGWNPADLLQAEARAHRIGQKRKVSIWYLIAVNTIEEKLYKLLEKKQGYLEKALDGVKAPEDLDIFKLLQKELMNGS